MGSISLPIKGTTRSALILIVRMYIAGEQLAGIIDSASSVVVMGNRIVHHNTVIALSHVFPAIVDQSRH